MKQCKKKTFASSKEAKQRAKEINAKNEETNQQTEKLRQYKCEYCGKFHLTKMDRNQYKYKKDVNYRNKINEKAFINREARYWEKYFGLE